MSEIAINDNLYALDLVVKVLAPYRREDKEFNRGKVRWAIKNDMKITDDKEKVVSKKLGGLKRHFLTNKGVMAVFEYYHQKR